MNHIEYKNAATRTESKPEAIVGIGTIQLHAAFLLMVAASKVANQFKRQIFYGKSLDGDKTFEALDDLMNAGGFLAAAIDHGQLGTPALELAMSGVTLPPELMALDTKNVNIRLLHSAIGIFTEAGEMLEHLFRAYEGKDFDKVGFAEELGDVDWYKAIGHDETGTDEVQLRIANIAKLKARYPDKFSTDAAVNRDLDTERHILETQQGVTQ